MKAMNGLIRLLLIVCFFGSKLIAVNGSSQKISNYNTTYDVLKTLNLDEETKRLFLNLTGTILYKDKKISIYPPKEENFLPLLKRGGTLNTAYKFVQDPNNANVINIEETSFMIPFENAWVKRVLIGMRSLKRKMLYEKSRPSSTKNSLEDELLLNFHFPVQQILLAKGKYHGKKGNAIISINECVDIIALEYVSDFIQDVIVHIIERAQELRKGNLNDKEFSDYMASLERVKEEVVLEQQKFLERARNKEALINQIMKYDEEARKEYFLLHGDL